VGKVHDAENMRSALAATFLQSSRLFVRCVVRATIVGCHWCRVIDRFIWLRHRPIALEAVQCGIQQHEPRKQN
jgi:hypothetical protein